ncbi:unnamed protein product [Miscanthus lutarioriparius]|uniref:Uncharacterized protein n=1 Tax=Miscanthus lutarioriparius TaxID=422564 RepID=A0A811SFU5_9POAL|nr:unnamed protein product [Miscanthus lutarioriparius]
MAFVSDRYNTVVGEKSPAAGETDVDRYNTVVGEKSPAAGETDVDRYNTVVGEKSPASGGREVAGSRVMPMRRLFMYEGPGVPPFPDLVGSLRSSLATVLAIFFPLAGKLTYRPSAGGDVVVDCSPAAVSSGVKFVEAEYAGGIDDMRRVASGGGDEGDRDALMELGPELDARQLPAPVIAVQVTRPAVGSGRAVVVAVAIRHAVADGHSVWQFMRTWTAVARAEEGSEAMARLMPPTSHLPYSSRRRVGPGPPLPPPRRPRPSSRLPPVLLHGGHSQLKLMISCQRLI